jgi:serine/threonine protein kinase/Tol biopolymer transport system component
MTPERWKTIEALYNEVAELPPDKQAARLASISDPEVVKEVESLLATADIGNSGDPEFWWSNLVDKAVDRTSIAGLDAPSVPQQIGPWRIVKAIGKGGMGEVYLAEDVRLGRRVAVKLLSDAIAARSDALDRFRQEARTASALNHPNIVTIHEIGEDQGRHYIVTEYVEGQTVRKLLAGGALPFERCLDIATQTASALAAAHAAGIIHRDIKPENLMVRPDGFVKVLDFGLAKLLTAHRPDITKGLDSPPTITNAGMILGTPGYMSPEQARGQTADARSDLFSLGAVLHTILTGTAPFTRATTIETLAALLERDPPPLSGSPGVPEEMAPIVGRLLAKNAAQRYQSAAELLADLRQVRRAYESSHSAEPVASQTGNTPLPAPQITQAVGSPATLPPTRARSTRWLLIAIAACVLVLAGGVWRWTRPAPSIWFQSSRLTGIPGNGMSRTQVLSPDGRYIAYETLLPNGTRSLSVRLLAENSVIELASPAPVAYDALAFSPDGSYLYYVMRKLAPGNAGILFFKPVLGGTAHKVLEGVVGKLAFSADGTALAFVRQIAHEKVLAVSSPDGSGLKELLRSQAAFAFVAVDWSTDSREIFYVETSGSPNQPNSRILAISRNGGTPRLLVRPGGLFVYDLAVLPDGSGFVANAFDREAGLPQIWQIPRDAPARLITHDLAQYQGLSLSRDGTRILTSQVGRISELWLVDRNDPGSTQQITEPGRRFDTPVWTHDGTVVSVRVEAGKWILWATAPDGQAQHPLLQKSALDLEPSACPDRDEIVFSSGRSGGAFTIWRSSGYGSELKQLTFGAYDRLPQCVAGGTVIYQAQADTGKVNMRVPLDGGAASLLSSPTYDQLVSPDGRLMLVPYDDEKTHERRIAVRSRDSSAVVATFPYGGRAFAWAPDSQGFADARSPGGASEVWYQPLSGPARQLTKFGKDTIFALNWSTDGHHLVCARGRFNSDMVLIHDAR